MNILEFLKKGGQVRKMQTAAGGPIKLYDTLWVDNWKNRLTSPTVVAKQLTELTSKIPIKYLGGSKNNVRKEFWKQEPVFQHAVDSIANQYGISPESLKYRLDREGFTDRLIQRRNARIKIGALRFEPRGYELLNNPNYGLAGTQIGLDDAKTYIDSGKVKLINENWYEQGPFKNEKGRMTYPVNPVTLNDGMGIVAAHLKYFRDEALLDFPNGSEYDLDRYANAYYNRGTYGGKKWVLAGAKGYSYRKKGGMLQLLKNGSGIHIKEKNKGSFTRWCGGNVTEECIRKGKASSNPKIRRKATFADNTRKWKHEKGGCFKGYPSKAAYDVRLEEVAGFKKGGKAFVEGVNVLDSNPDAYKHVKKKVKMRSYGGPLEYLFKEAQYLNWVNDYLNPTVINYNPDINANRNFKFNNSILLLTDEYNNLKLLEAERINNEAQRYGSFLSKGLELLFGYLNKPKAVSNNSTNFNTDSWSKVNKDLAGTSYIKPDTNNKLFTSNVIGSNMNVTYDDMRNLK